jgi:hypothetical protein
MFIWLLVKHGARSTEHTEHGAVEKRKSFIIKYTVYYYKFLLLLIKFFLVLHVGGSKKIGLLKNTCKTAKSQFKIGLWNSLSYIYQAYEVMFIIYVYSLYYIILYYIPMANATATHKETLQRKHLDWQPIYFVTPAKNSQVYSITFFQVADRLNIKSCNEKSEFSVYPSAQWPVAVSCTANV